MYLVRRLLNPTIALLHYVTYVTFLTCLRESIATDRQKWCMDCPCPAVQGRQVYFMVSTFIAKEVEMPSYAGNHPYS